MDIEIPLNFVCEQQVEPSCDNCDFCKKEITWIPLKSEELKFCDMVCAKLYNDNVSSIIPDMNEYKQHYLNNLLVPYARKIYETCPCFVTMPYMKLEDLPRPDSKKYYVSILLK